jgi:hypothetical protein
MARRKRKRDFSYWVSGNCGGDRRCNRPRYCGYAEDPHSVQTVRCGTLPQVHDALKRHAKRHGAKLLAQVYHQNDGSGMSSTYGVLDARGLRLPSYRKQGRFRGPRRGL